MNATAASAAAAAAAAARWLFEVFLEIDGSLLFAAPFEFELQGSFQEFEHAYMRVTLEGTGALPGGDGVSARLSFVRINHHHAAAKSGIIETNNHPLTKSQASPPRLSCVLNCVFRCKTPPYPHPYKQFIRISLPIPDPPRVPAANTTPMPTQTRRIAGNT